jgi:hypothetical protein
VFAGDFGGVGARAGAKGEFFHVFLCEKRQSDYFCTEKLDKRNKVGAKSCRFVTPTSWRRQGLEKAIYNKVYKTLYIIRYTRGCITKVIDEVWKRLYIIRYRQGLKRLYI